MVRGDVAGIQLERSTKFPFCAGEIPIVADKYTSQRDVGVAQSGIELQSFHCRRSSEAVCLNRWKAGSPRGICTRKPGVRGGVGWIFVDGLLEMIDGLT